MIVITRVRRNGTVDMLIVLAEENIDRIKRHDPAEIMWHQLPPDYSMRRPGAIAVGFATAEEQAHIQRLSETDADWKEKAFKLLSSGFEFRPDLGDHDFGPVVLGEPTKGSKQ